MRRQDREPHPCPGCGRRVAYRTAIQRLVGGGKHRVRHKCRHGRWCVFGHALAGNQGHNGPTCRECQEDRRSDTR